MSPIRAADPGGVINMFSSWRDDVHWSADSWWHFNLRQPVHANFGAGIADFNMPYFRLYLDRLEEMREWTRSHWPEADGICVPEFLRFDGTAGACDSSAEPSWLNRIVTTGPEVIYNLWLQYRHTGDRELLDEGYPAMLEVINFYLSILEEGDDGYLHLHNVNAMETQWDTSDPTPDLAAMRTVFPLVAELAEERGDTEIANRLRTAATNIAPFRTVTRNGEEVLAWSATDEEAQNTQNPDMEALFPWGVFGTDSELMQSTFENRVFVLTREWAEDPLWAARLGRPDDMKSLLIQGTEDFQVYPSGFTGHDVDDDPVRTKNYYNGWGAVVTSSLQESLVQGYEGVIRVAHAWPADWEVAGTIELEGGHRVSTQVQDGTPNVVGIEAGSDELLQIENPWPGERVRVVDGELGRGKPIVNPTREDMIELAVEADESYLLERIGNSNLTTEFQQVEGEPAAEVKSLGERRLGVDESVSQIRSDVVAVREPSTLSALVRAEEGVPYYIDRSFVLSDLPEQLADTVLIRGANEDGSMADPPEEYLTFELFRPTTVYVAFDLRGEGEWWPDWVQELGFQRTEMVVETTDTPLAVFAVELPAGEHALGPNSEIPGEGSSQYITFVDEAG